MTRSLFPTAVLVLASSITVADEPGSRAGLDYFETHIRPLLAEKCYACHSTRAKKSKGGLLLDSRASLLKGGKSGPAIVPGDPDASLLIRAVRYTDEDLEMPPDEALPKSAVAHLERWIRIGAPDPRTGEAAGDDAGPDPADPIAGRAHWVFRPLKTVDVSKARDADWARSPIDSFLLAKLESKGLRPAPDADRRTLARRVHVALIGIPPTPEELDSFLSDERPDAFEQLVDSLLASRHFGERWGRHWLDLARYADSNGLDENFLFREAWRYRNWVIDAVNADMPFDRFLLEQIAGDLLPYDSIAERDRQRIGAGFLVVGPKVLLGVPRERQRMEVADEQIDTVGRAVLGMTLGCARCHDHKFDPVPTADYYALAGIFTSTEVMEQRFMLGQQRVMERLVGLGEKGDEANGAYEGFWRERKARESRAKEAKTALDLLQKGDEAAIADYAKQHKEAFAGEATDTTKEKNTRVAAQQAHLQARIRAATPPKIPPRAMIPVDRSPKDERIRIAGQHTKHGKTVPRGFLSVMGDQAAEIPKGRSGRIELATWLTDVDSGAGRVAARVYANRVWRHLIGVGIVRTADNFGRTGEAPSHPRLLDHLANELIAGEWSTKSLIRKIVLSRSFALSSRHDDAAHAIDPANRLLWRAHRRRLEPEVLRDAMLTAAGTLDRKSMESTVAYLGDQATAVGANKNRRRTDYLCRSLYLPIIRNDLPELLDVFDFADPHRTTGARPKTMVATQGLYLLNAESVQAASDATAQRVLSHASPVDELYEFVLGAKPASEERGELLGFVQKMQDRFAARGEKDSKLRAWSLASQALFASSRFQILE